FELRLNGLFQGLEAGLKLVVVERLYFGFAVVDRGNQGLQFLDIALVLCADEPRDDPVNEPCCIHEVSLFPLRTHRAGRPHERTNTPAQTLYSICLDARAPNREQEPRGTGISLGTKDSPGAEESRRAAGNSAATGERPRDCRRFR